MLRGFIEIDRIAACVNLSKNIVNISRDLYKKALESKQLEANTNEAVASACLYIAARQEKSALSFKNVVHASKCGKRALRKCFVRIVKIFNIHLEPDIYTDPFVNSLCNDLDLPYYVLRMTHHIVQEAQEKKIVSQCDRQAVIAAAIFMASQVSYDKRSQKDVENISGLASEAIWEAYRLMHPHASDLIPINFELSAPIQSLPKI
ncbi:transcription initiation factor IIB-like [Cydia pomonella]|uniref:transcription initiation factor IIB-like n=1 Tax=Cydia pomonella TaxID=82600 RepID=UPI002ADD3C2B|nr:transcription initiation factor IIB-like [Cydia pomonella]